MNFFLLDDGRLRAGWRFAIAVVAVFIVNMIAGMLAASSGVAHPRMEDVIYRPTLAGLLLLCFFGMTRIFDQPEGSSWTYIGLPRRNWGRELLAGTLLGIALIFLAVVIIAIFFNYHITQITLNPRTLILPIVVLFVLVTGALAEELMFRGYPFQRLVEWVGPAGAIMILSALFGAVHLHNPHVSDSRAVQAFAFSNTLLIGIVLALAYLRTRALWFPWGLHLAWNATLGLVFGLPVSGISSFALLVKAKARGPEWFLGGGYGIEGGALGTLLVILGLGYVVLFVKPRAAILPALVDEVASSSIQPTGTL